MTTFIDTNVLIYLVDPKARHHQWSVQQLWQCKANGPVILSDIVYCEFSVGMATRQDVDAVVTQFALERFSWNDQILFDAGKAFQRYKAAKTGNTNVLPDFLIGATAEATGAPLMTANAKDFVKFFPALKLIVP